MAVSSSYVRAPTRQKTLEAKSAIAGKAKILYYDCLPPYIPFCGIFFPFLIVLGLSLITSRLAEKK
jgi:hypothetical protein